MYVYPKEYDVIVIGGGHAGIEAALASARIGCETLLLTSNLDTIGQMSCNPAIGGLAKGHLVREIDALGGEMAKTTDLSGLQFRMLNTRKGPAVRAPRAQCDKKAYQFRMKWVCERQSRLDCKQGHSTKLVLQGLEVCGVETTMGVAFHGRSVIITTGTFLRGLMHMGDNQQAGGRAGDSASSGLSASLADLGIRLGRLKTGTPPRLLRRSIDFQRTEPQVGDDPIPYFSHWKEDLFHVEQAPGNSAGSCRVYPSHSVLGQLGHQLPCYLTHTTVDTGSLIKANIDKSPMYSGRIEGIGPRYCPSIEDKIMRFPEKGSHQIFLEPEGIGTEEIYVNGLSTCLPYEVQMEVVRTLIGCERAEIVRAAYAVEYDFAFPEQLKHSLESKVYENLFLAGQINGTSGYEEAAAQGLVAGINAARKVQGKCPIIFARDEAYIGVLIDDLILKGTLEPYRMFTSRAEHRLTLRQDNADLRLSHIGYEIGLLPQNKYFQTQKKMALIENELDRLAKTRIGRDSLAQLLRRPNVSYKDLPQGARLPSEIAEQVEIVIKYQGYIERQLSETARFETYGNTLIPKDFDYSQVLGIRMEARQKLQGIRPSTVGQALRISGVSPADVSLLLVWLKRGSKFDTHNLN